jgi:hypothetical protein
MVVYQHLQRNAWERVGDIERRLRDLSTHVGTPYIWAVQWADLAFLVAVHEPTLAGRVSERLRQHAQRHDGLLFEHRRRQSADSHRKDGPMPDRCKHGMDSRFCSLCASASRPTRRQTNAKVNTSTTGTYELRDIVRYLNEAQVRATYGAVAELVGGIARGIGARLTALYSRSPEASWVVSAESGLPTGYAASERHPALLKDRHIIKDGDELRRRLAEWKAAGAPNRPTSVVAPTGTASPVLRKRSVLEAQPQPTPTKPLSVDDLAELRRKLMALLDGIDTSKRGVGKGIRKRINRLSYDGGPVPREIAALMTTITEMRNSAEYESKVLSDSECAVVRHAWQAIQEWAQSRRV